MFSNQQIIMNAKTVMVMYLLPEKQTQQHKSSQYPNAFIVQTNKELTPALIRPHLSHARASLNEHIRFALKAGEQTFWLDLSEDEAVPFYSENTVFLQLTGRVQ